MLRHLALCWGLEWNSSAMALSLPVPPPAWKVAEMAAALWGGDAVCTVANAGLPGVLCFPASCHPPAAQG